MYKLLPPRPNFLMDMSSEEGAIMDAHLAYWRGLMDEGHVAAFGPVADPKGAYGVVFVMVEDGADPTLLADRDPAITCRLGFQAEIHPMPLLVHAGASA